MTASASQAGCSVIWNAQGMPVSLRGANLMALAGSGGTHGPAAQNATARAHAALDALSAFYGIRDSAREFMARAPLGDSLGCQHVRLDQYHRGLRVVGGQLICHFDGQGLPYEVNGRYVPDLDVRIEPELDARDALSIARRHIARTGAGRGQRGGNSRRPLQVVLQCKDQIGGASDLNGATLETIQTPEMVVFAMQTAPVLAYELTLATLPGHCPPAVWRCWIGAGDGRVLLAFDDIKPATISGHILEGEGGHEVHLPDCYAAGGWYALSNNVQRWAVCDAANGDAAFNPAASKPVPDWGTTDRAALSAAYNFDRIQRYFLGVHGRNGFDGQGAWALANIHVFSNYPNAFWHSSYQQFYFGDGDGALAAPLSVLDVCAHEFTHAVTEHSANLFYWDESGALNESFSDIMAACLEFHCQPDGRALYPSASAGLADWLIGEDCWNLSPALRDMRNPANSLSVGSGYEQPSRYRGAHWTWGNGEVHQNNGPQNFFFYLLSEGGSGNNDGIDYSVSGIGVSNAAAVAYRALTVYCGPYTDYEAARAAWGSAAADLNPAWTAPVQAAWDAVYRPKTDFGPWETEGPVYKGQALGSGGVVYAVAGDKRMYAFQLSGTPLHTWQLSSGDMETPAVTPDGAIILNEYDFNGANSFRIYNPDGTTNGSFPLPGCLLQIWGHPAVGSAGQVYCLALDDTSGFSELRVCRFNPDGQLGRLWTVPQWCTIMANCGPVVGRDDAVYATAQIFTGERYDWDHVDGAVVSFAPDGTTNCVWIAPGASNQTCGISAVPALAADGSIVVATYHGFVHSFHPNGATNFSRYFPEINFLAATPAIGADGAIYVAGVRALSENIVFALNPDGTVRRTWNAGNYDDSGWCENTGPTIGADGTIYVLTAASAIHEEYGPRGKLYAFHPDGGTNFVRDLGAVSPWAFPALGPDGTIYAGSATGGLYVCAGTGGALATNAPWPQRFYDSRNSACLSTNMDFPPAAPNGLSASKGTFCEKVRVTWTAVSRADAYQIWRHTADDSSAATLIGASAQTNYDDTSAAGGQIYYYWVKAINIVGASAFSDGDSGFVLIAPTGVSASKGTCSDRVTVTWSTASFASGYQVWRHTAADASAATQIGATTDAYFSDTSASGGTLYYYWVKATYAASVTPFSSSDSGWRRSVGHSHYADTDIDGDRKADLVIFDPASGTWRARLSAFGYAEVSGILGGPACTLVPGDYDGDGLTDPGVYEEASGLWTVMLSSLGYGQASATLGGLGHAPTPGDFDGDFKTDLGVYQSATGGWTVKLSASGYTEAGTIFGDANHLPVQRDYDGDQKCDPAIYHLANGNWRVMLSASGYGIATAVGFGGTGYAPVVGDYDADGLADPAIYHESTGLWTVMLSGSGYLIATGSLGGSGYAALPGDYDGDGKTDPGVYHTTTGQWLVLLSGSGYGIATAVFGGEGVDPVGLRPE